MCVGVVGWGGWVGGWQCGWVDVLAGAPVIASSTAFANASPPSLPNHPSHKQVSQQQRDHAKQLTYGLLYGMGASRLADELGCSVAEAKEAMVRVEWALASVSWGWGSWQEGQPAS